MICVLFTVFDPKPKCRFLLSFTKDHPFLLIEESMGKKAKKSTKQAWKKSEAAKEYEEVIKTVKEDEGMANEASDKLFFIDTTGLIWIMPKSYFRV